MTYASLLGLDLWSSDIQNAYISAPTTEKYFFVCGPEFGSENVDRKDVVKHALYGMKFAR